VFQQVRKWEWWRFHLAIPFRSACGHGVGTLSVPLHRVRDQRDASEVSPECTRAARIAQMYISLSHRALANAPVTRSPDTIEAT
jgi:hypothetical protein